MEISLENLYVDIGTWRVKGGKKGQEIKNVFQDQVELKKNYSEWKSIMGRDQGK